MFDSRSAEAAGQHQAPAPTPEPKQAPTPTPAVEVFTDGACKGNPGPGGWGALLRYGAHEKELFGGEAQTTNNRMELMAVIQALEALKRQSEVILTVDSRYVRDGVERWMKGWKRNGWMTKQRTPVKNKDLWQRLDQALAGHRVRWHWVRGHSGHAENERADQLANKGIPRDISTRG